MPGKNEIKAKEAKRTEKGVKEGIANADNSASEGSAVKVHYTGKLADGTVFDSSAGREPIGFTVGQHQVIPGFEKAVKGMKAGEKKTITIPSNEAYGDHNPQLVQKVPLEAVKKAGITPEKGMVLGLGHPARPGMEMPARVVEVDEATVTLDLNHPLAGKDLTFELELMEIN